MTEKELSKYYWIKKDIEDTEKRLYELGYGLTIPQLSDEPKSINSNNRKLEKLTEKRLELINLYIEQRVTALEEYLKIERFISAVEDSEIKLIMRYRFLDLKQWDEIGKELHSDRTTVSKKMRKYLEVSHNSHTKDI